MILRMRYCMAEAPLQGLLDLTNGVNPARYSVEHTCTLLDDGRELWLVHKAAGPRGGAGALYRVALPVYSPRVLPNDLRATASCTCPDFRFGAQRLGGVCKHVLMCYCWQGCYAGTGERWLYTDAYLATLRFFRSAYTATEVQHG